MASQYEPTPSDTTVLMSVEELIGLAMGPSDVNTVNFKIMESVLMVLARQLRILGTHVEVKFGDQTEVSTQVRQESAEAWSESKKRALAVLSRRDRGPEAVFAVQTTSTKVRPHGKKPRSRSRRRSIRPCRDTSDEDYDTGVCDSESCLRRNLEAIKARQRSGGGGGRSPGGRGRSPDDDRRGSRSSSRGRRDAKDGKKGKKRHRTPEGKKGRNQSGIITISEKEIEKSKIQVTDNSQVRRVGSIEVVTHSEFALLEQAVRELRERGAPPAPALPDNAQLREELAEGRASLPDAMQAMQVNARIQATEEMIARLAGIMTQLAASGAIPADLSYQLAQITGAEGETTTGSGRASRMREKGGADGAGTSGAGGGAGAGAGAGAGTGAGAGAGTAYGPLGARPSKGSRTVGVYAPGKGEAGSGMTQRTSVRSTASDAGDFVTHREMDDCLGELRDELLNNLKTSAGQASTTADKASEMAHRVGEKMEVAMKIDERVSTLHSLVEDYAEQLNGFDTGLATQMQGFQEQMSQMRSDLAEGLKLLEASNTNAETLAVQELRERYEGAVADLDNTVHAHGALQNFQWQLAEELQSLLEAVDNLREQKADREEVLDRLRDKADISRLQGLLTDETFELAKSQLNEKLALAYDKFGHQEEVWLGALKELNDECQSKADLMQLTALRDDAQEQLRDLHHQLQQLERAVGEPEAAMLTRQLAKDAMCGVCKAPALMPYKDEGYEQPPRLPAFRPPPAGAEQEECLREIHPAPPVDERTHMCHRWVGGSHTLVHAPARGPPAPLDVHLPPLRLYQALGRDGKSYMLSEELQPCVECAGLTEATEPECTCVPGHAPCRCIPAPPPRCLCPEEGDGDASPGRAKEGQGIVCDVCK